MKIRVPLGPRTLDHLFWHCQCWEPMTHTHTLTCSYCHAYGVKQPGSVPLVVCCSFTRRCGGKKCSAYLANKPILVWACWRRSTFVSTMMQKNLWPCTSSTGKGLASRITSTHLNHAWSNTARPWQPGPGLTMPALALHEMLGTVIHQTHALTTLTPHFVQAWYACTQMIFNPLKVPLNQQVIEPETLDQKCPQWCALSHRMLHPHFFRVLSQTWYAALSPGWKHFPQPSPARRHGSALGRSLKARTQTRWPGNTVPKLRCLSISIIGNDM